MSSNKLLIPVAAVLVAAAAYWFLLLAPKREEAARLTDEVATKQAAVDQAEATVATYQKAQGAYQRNYATVVRLGKAVPGDDDIRSLMVQVNAEADRAGVDFNSIELGGAAAGAGTQTDAASGSATPPPGAQSVGAAGFWVMPLQLDFGGSFADLSVFFAKLERFVTLSEQDVEVTGRLLRFDSVHLEADGRKLRAEVGASSYLVPPAEGVTGGATPSAPKTTTTAARSASTTTGATR